MTAPASVVRNLVALDVSELRDVELRYSAVLYAELRRLFEMLDFKVEQLFADGRFAFRPVVGLYLDAVEIYVLRKLSLHCACLLYCVLLMYATSRWTALIECSCIVCDS